MTGRAPAEAGYGGTRAIRRIVAIGAAAVAGAILGATVAQTTIVSRAEMQQWAAELVPPDAVMTDSGELSGPEILVGRYEAVAGFDTRGIPAAAVSDQLMTHARALGWTHVETAEYPGGDIQRWLRREAEAAIYIRDFEGPGDGTIYVHYRDSPTDRLIVGSLLGGSIGVVAAGVYLAMPHVLLRTRAKR